MSRNALLPLVVALAGAVVLLAWWNAGYDVRLGVLIYVPAGLALVAGVAGVAGVFGRLRDARWAFASMLPVNAIAALFLVLLLANDFQRRENGGLLTTFLAVNLAAVAALAVAVSGPPRWRPPARRMAMLVAALGCAAFVLGVLLAIVSALS